MLNKLPNTNFQLDAFRGFVCLFLISFTMVAMAILAIAFIINSYGKYAPLPPLFLVVLIAYLLAIFIFIPWYKDKLQSLNKKYGKRTVMIEDYPVVKNAAKNVEQSRYIIEIAPHIAKKEADKSKISLVSWEDINNKLELATDFAKRIALAIRRNEMCADIYTRIAVNLIVAGGCERIASCFALTEDAYKQILSAAISEVDVAIKIMADDAGADFHNKLNSPDLEPYNKKLIAFGMKAMDKILHDSKTDLIDQLWENFLYWREHVIKELLPLDGVATLNRPLTMMFTDIVDSTMMTEINGEHFAYEIMHVHNDVVAKAIHDFKGRQIKLMGDGVFACFSSPEAGVKAAVQMQRDWAKFNKENPEKVFFVRIGLNLGNPIVEDGDLFGLCVGRASRVCHVAQGATIFVTHDLHDDLTTAGFNLKDEGLFNFKGIVEKERVYSIDWENPFVNKNKQAA